MDNPAHIELAESHDYIRHISGLYAAWFTFFLTISLAANAWSFHASLDANGNLVAPLLFFGVLTFFEIQIFLGILGTRVVRISLRQKDERALNLLKHIAEGFEGAAAPATPVRDGLHQALTVM